MCTLIEVKSTGKIRIFGLETFLNIRIFELKTFLKIRIFELKTFQRFESLKKPRNKNFSLKIRVFTEEFEFFKRKKDLDS